MTLFFAASYRSLPAPDDAMRVELQRDVPLSMRLAAARAAASPAFWSWRRTTNVCAPLYRSAARIVRTESISAKRTMIWPSSRVSERLRNLITGALRSVVDEDGRVAVHGEAVH